MQPEIQAKIEEFIKHILSGIYPKSSHTLIKEGDQWRVEITTDANQDISEISPREVIQAAQHYLRILIHKHYPKDRTHFILDINNYRAVREKKIKIRIPNLAENKVLIQGKTVVMLGLTGYERMIVHQLLSDIKGVSTSSVGPQHNRKLLIMPESETGSTGMDKALFIDIDKEEI